MGGAAEQVRYHQDLSMTSSSPSPATESNRDIPSEHAPALKEWMDRIQGLAKRLAA